MHPRPSSVRHQVLWLTVAAYMITYMDRVVISTAAPSIREEFGFDLVTMGIIMSSFRWGYALFQIPGGWLGDYYGPRRALTLIVTWWSAFTSMTAFMGSAATMTACRFLFGVGEAGAFPIATRSLSRWMLPSERGYAQGVTHAGSRLGAALTPPLVAWLIIQYGWRMPFYIFGALGLIWAAVWYLWYRDTPEQHASVNEQELALIRSGLGATRRGSGTKVPWPLILRSRTLWQLSAMYFCYSWCIVVYLDWLPTYLRESREMDIKTMGFYAMLPYLAGTVGDLAGGWFSDRLVHRTGNLCMGRRWVAIAGFLLAALSIVPATRAADPQLSIIYTCIAVFGLELTVGVSWAIPLDIGGDYAGTVSAVMNTCGNIGGAISTLALGLLVRGYGWNLPFFLAAGFCTVAAILYLGIDASRHIEGEKNSCELTPTSV